MNNKFKIFTITLLVFQHSLFAMWYSEADRQYFRPRCISSEKFNFGPCFLCGFIMENPDDVLPVYGCDSTCMRKVEKLASESTRNEIRQLSRMVDILRESRTSIVLLHRYCIAWAAQKFVADEDKLRQFGVGVCRACIDVVGYHDNRIELFPFSPDSGCIDVLKDVVKLSKCEKFSEESVYPDLEKSLTLILNTIGSPGRSTVLHERCVRYRLEQASPLTNEFYSLKPVARVPYKIWVRAMFSLYSSEGKVLNLTNLSLTWQQLADLINGLPLKFKSSITRLNVAHNNLTVLPAMSDLCNLVEINAEDNPLTTENLN